MKLQKYIYLAALITTTLLAAWGMPALLKKAIATPPDYPFVYYSSLLNELCFIDFKDDEKPMHDKSGNAYTVAQFDSLMPLLNFKQLTVDGKIPDSLGGFAITPQLVRSTTVVFRHEPSDSQTPEMGLHVMFESMPARTGVELPEDFFRMRDDIEFINPETNRVDHPKSTAFRDTLKKTGFVFPAQWVSGNPNPRKPYDEGYFCLDAQGQLFHMKMVNNRPFVRNTHMGDSLNIASFSMLEAEDRRFYGFLFDKQGGIHIIENRDEKYKTIRLDIDPINIHRDEILVMGNLLYWTVSVTTPSGINYYALNTKTLKRVDEYHMARQAGAWENWSEWLFPVYITVEHRYSDYIYPAFTFTGLKFLVVHLFLALGILLPAPNMRKRKQWSSLYVLFTGFAGLVSLLLLPGFPKKQHN